MNRYLLMVLFLFSVFLLFSADTFKDGDSISYADGRSAGTAVQISTRLWLDGKTDIKDGIESLSVTKPTGFKLPSKSDLNVLLQFALKHDDPEGFIREVLKVEESERYLMSSTKVHEGLTDGSDINAWAFYGLDLKKMSIEKIATYAIVHEWSGNKKSEYSARLVADTIPISIVFNGIGGTEREFESNLLDADSYVWTIEESEYEGKRVKHNFSQTGDFEIKLKVISNGVEEEYSKTVNINKSYGSFIDYKTVDVNSIKSFDLDFVCKYPEFNRYGYNKLQTAPLVCTDDGNIFVLSTNSERILTLIKTDLNGNLIEKKELHEGYPGNLSCKENVIAYLTKIGNDRADLRFVDETGTDRVIMNNKGIYDSDSKGTLNNGKGLIFKDGKGKMIFGTEAMFEPFAFGRVELFSTSNGWISIFPHSNNFNASNQTTGKYVDSKNNYHCGEMCLYYSNDAEDIDLIYGWGASHSMDLRSVYDGEYIASVTLGDVYPCDFRFFLIDPIEKKYIQSDLFASNKYKDALIGYTNDGKEYYGVAGGPGGMSAKLGEVMVVDYGKYAFTYSIRTGDFNNSYIAKGGVFKSKINELGLMVIDRNGSVLLRKKIRSGNDVEFLHSARYGKNILLAWKTIDKNEYKMCLIDKDGNILQNEFVLPENVYFNPSDGFDVLNNGSIAWTAVKNTVKKEGNLNLFILNLPLNSAGRKRP